MLSKDHGHIKIQNEQKYGHQTMIERKQDAKTHGEECFRTHTKNKIIIKIAFLLSLMKRGGKGEIILNK